ncbi:MAG: DUF2130 domain-containing protein [Cellulomonadaceae bacterium]|jgi:hypothetical protein|nr:DUF2130 domain-containing protein [Cellulomonadaceae bacterium]
MLEIQCPHCGQSFTLSDNIYSEIQKKVRDQEFDADLHERLALAEREKAQELELAATQSAKALDAAVAAKDAEVARLKAERASELATLKASRDADVARLQADLDKSALSQKVAVKDALAEVTSERDRLAEKLEAQARAAEDARKLAIQEALAPVTTERDRLASELEKNEVARELAVTKAVEAVAKERDAARSAADRLSAEKETSEMQLKEGYRLQLQEKDHQIEMLRDMRAKQSTKMVGETLEQHCEIEFNRVRGLGFQNAYFEKDSEVVDGTKGDYVYRDYTDSLDATSEPVEFISIMFEMKNEQDTGKSGKVKNEAHFKKLDADRKKKGCEYAVLVSLLEPDNDLYNDGIVAVHNYEKMFVIRPQFFITLITLLRNAALASAGAKAELELARQRNVDVTNFEDHMNKFREGFDKNYSSAQANFEEAIKQIDKSIAAMEATKRKLLTTGNQLRLANNKAQELTIKRLTRGNATMKAAFANARSTTTEE